MKKYLLILIKAISNFCSWSHSKLDPQCFSVELASFDELKHQYLAAASDRDAHRQLADSFRRKLEKRDARIKGLMEELDNQRKLATPSDHMEMMNKTLLEHNKVLGDELNLIKFHLTDWANTLPAKILMVGKKHLPVYIWRRFSEFANQSELIPGVGELVTQIQNDPTLTASEIEEAHKKIVERFNEGRTVGAATIKETSEALGEVTDEDHNPESLVREEDK